jgi:hypothetical protein
MKKQILSSVFLLAVASNALAASYIFSDADRFGSLVTSGTNPPIGSPAGVTLTAGGPTPSVSSSFDIVNPDGTPSFTLGVPYPFTATYNSVLGFTPGLIAVDYGLVTLFLRDPSGGSETLEFTASTFLIEAGSVGTQLVVSDYATAAVTAALDATGAFNYTITATSGSFILDAAYLQVGATTVPDGGSTATLLGSALLVGTFLRRRYGMA